MNIRFSKVAAIAVAGLSLLPAAAFADTTPAPLDTTGYSSIFGQLTSDLTTVATGPVGIGAFGALTVGIIFRIVWKLYKKSGNAIG